MAADRAFDVMMAVAEQMRRPQDHGAAPIEATAIHVPSEDAQNAML